MWSFGGAPCGHCGCWHQGPWSAIRLCSLSSTLGQSLWAWAVLDRAPHHTTKHLGSVGVTLEWPGLVSLLHWVLGCGSSQVLSLEASSLTSREGGQGSLLPSCVWAEAAPVWNLQPGRDGAGGTQWVVTSPGA